MNEILLFLILRFLFSFISLEILLQDIYFANSYNIQKIPLKSQVFSGSRLN